jgi:hypothetical protein
MFNFLQRSAPRYPTIRQTLVNAGLLSALTLTLSPYSRAPNRRERVLHVRNLYASLERALPELLARWEHEQASRGGAPDPRSSG